MSDVWYISRFTLRQDADMRAIAPIFLPADEDERISISHRLIWSVFADDTKRARDFLWHEEGQGSYLVLSPHQPPRESLLFQVESKPFSHWPQTGDRVSFFLRVNPTVSKAQQELKKNGKRKGGKRIDVVMQALHLMAGRTQTKEPLRPREGRAFLRDDLLGWVPDEESIDPRRPVENWLTNQGLRYGFMPADMRVNAYRRVSLGRPGCSPKDALVFGQAEIAGELVVTDADAFAARLTAGFGRAKAFGCGLMLLAKLGE